jgi:hypothetical protein
MKKVILLALTFGLLSISQVAFSSDDSAAQQLKGTDWVKDVFVSPGHMNVGVIAGEKDWTSPMIARFVCGVLKSSGSNINLVRFVNIEQVVYQNQTPRDAEISKFRCNDLM